MEVKGITPTKGFRILIYQQRLYDWERNHVEPLAQYFLSRDECRELVGRASRLAGIQAPEIRFAKASSMPCRAVPSKWQIVIADWGRTPVTVLHEVAHLATLRAVLAGQDPHGPAFLAQAIVFYSAFLGLDKSRLAASAQVVGLHVGDMPRPVAHTRGFSDVDF